VTPAARAASSYVSNVDRALACSAVTSTYEQPPRDSASTTGAAVSRNGPAQQRARIRAARLRSNPRRLTTASSCGSSGVPISSNSPSRPPGSGSVTS